MSRTLDILPASRPRFVRSIRLDYDLRDDEALASYMITPQVRSVLRRVGEALSYQSTERAWTITGPYGTGKSACALFLTRLVAAPNSKHEPAWSLLRQRDPLLAHDLADALHRNGPLFPVAVTLRRASLAKSISESLLLALEQLPESPKRSALSAALRADLSTEETDTRHLLDRTRILLSLARASGAYSGLLIVLDELGKALEYAARHKGDDIYALQELAELAQRSQETPLLVIGILHQAFESYATQLDRHTWNEWGKVQGRFADLAFLESAESLIRLAAQAVAEQHQSLALDPEVMADPESVARTMAAACLTPRQMSSAEFIDLAAAAAPLHPATLLALPHLFRRLAQNERSMFVYLLGSEPFGLQDVVHSHPSRLIRLPDLYDYCSANIGGLLTGQGVSRHWLER